MQLQALQNMELLEMEVCSEIVPNLHQAPSHCTLKGLTVIRLEGARSIDHHFFSELAHCCPDLEVLSIVKCSMRADGHLIWLPHRPSSAFPRLKELILTPEKPCRLWQLGRQLSHYPLKGTNEEDISTVTYFTLTLHTMMPRIDLGKLFLRA